MLLTDVTFDLTTTTDFFAVCWELDSTKWIVCVKKRDMTTFPTGFRIIGELMHISIFIQAIPTVERSIELIGEALTHETIHST